MMVSTKGRYALRVLIDLAEREGEGYVTLKDIAARQNISKKYLEQIVPMLNKADVVVGSRGFQGGYMLAKKPSEITVGEVLRITEGSLAPVACLDKEEPFGCERKSDCLTLPLWKGLYKTITDYLDGITLRDVLDNGSADNYVI